MTEQSNDGRDGGPRLVVGVGASAGGLEAFKALLSVMPSDCGMAFILIQHLDPSHKSLLAELLQPCTAMRVGDAEHGAVLEPNSVYIIRPDTALAVRRGRIELSEPTLQRGVRLPVDHLFRSLAREFKTRAIGIVLSGAGSDGTAGMREIQAIGGFTIAENPDEAAQSGMPKSAIDAGVVDLVLSIDEIPAALERFSNLPEREGIDDPDEPAAGETASERRPSPDSEQVSDRHLSRIAAVVEARAEFDIRAYKSATVQRRVLRRMTLTGHESIESYIEALREDETEQQALLRDLLINVTDFFRDPEAFEALDSMVVQPLVNDASAGETLRVWVPGAASGEEAYSIAILFLEAIRRSDKSLTLQVFATEIDHDALAIARTAVYTAAVAERLTRDRLERYFSPLDGQGFQVRPPLRDVVSFAVHDICKDPPFSRMHLVSCRNLMIYLQPQAQQKVLKALHFALRPSGALFLGTSESTGSRQDFTTISKKWRIYRKVGRSDPVIAQPRAKIRPQDAADSQQAARVAEEDRAPTAPSGLVELARRSVLDAHVPPTVVVAQDGEVLFMHGELRPYLRFPQGDPRLRVSNVVDQDIGTRVRAALYKCRRNKETVVAYSSPDAARPRRTKITATPASELGDNAVILSFEDAREAGAVEPALPETPEQEAVLDQLEKELEATREDLRNTVEELETSNEELRASNEESMSMNEELQSSNEELEATTEELRSLNEELTTVNSQLKDKVEQLEEANDDLSNFFASTRLATLFLDNELCIRRFTPAAQTLLNVTRADLGHLVRDIARPLLQEDLEAEARRVLDQLVPVSREIETADGNWLIRRVLPYRTESKRISGVVVTFTDVTDYKLAREALEGRERQQAVVAELSLKALQSADPVGFMTYALGEMQRMLKAPLCSVFEFRPEDDVLLLRSGAGWPSDELRRLILKSGTDSQPGYTLTVEQPVIVDDLAEERRFAVSEPIRERGFTSSVSCVIRDSDGVYGVLMAHGENRDGFSEDDANFVQSVANLIAGALSGHKERMRIAIERSVSKTLFESRGLGDAAPRIMEVFGEELGASVCELWLATDDRLVCRHFATPAEPERHEEISSKFAVQEFALGEGFIGEAWAENRVQSASVLQERSSFIRANEAAELGLLSGFAIPIRTASTVVGVFAFYTNDRAIPNPRLIQSFESLGTAMGEFMRRSDAETQRERLAAIVESSDDAIVSRDLDGTVRSWNHGAEKLFGYTAEEIVGESEESLLPEDRVHELQQANERALQGSGTDAFESVRRRKDGSAVDVSIALSPLRDGQGAVVGVSAIVRDITEMKQAHERLARADRQKDHFLAMLGHELRNPLAAIRNAADVVKLKGGGDEVLEHSQQILDRQSTQMAKLIDGILDASRIARGKISLDKEVIDLARLVGQSLDACRASIEESGLHLETAIEGPVWVEGDPVRLTQVADNLLSNAIKFTQAPGTLRVTVQRDRGEAVFEVEDSGQGIAEGELDEVFTAFFQAEQPISREAGGLGLGLSLSKGLVELHGGSIDVQSDGVGRGALFRIVLPAVKQPKRRSNRAPEFAGPTRILIVEDNRDAADTLAQVCEMTGHETHVAYDATQALRVAAETKPAVVLCDIGLPGDKNGYDVGRELRALLDSSAFLVALTGYGRPEDVEAALESGFDVHVTKPLDTAKLQQLLRGPGSDTDGGK